MIVPDVNLVVYAHNTRAPEHLAASLYWEGLLNSGTEVGLADVVILGFVRLTTRSGVLAHPLTASGATQVVAGWFANSNVVPLPIGPDHWKVFSRLLATERSPSGLVTDAHLAALAIERGATLHSRDRDFARWPELDWTDPLR